MLAPLLLLAALILPSALQQQTKTVELQTHNKIVELGGWLERWKAFSTDYQVNQEEALREVAAAGEEVRAQLEQQQVDLTDLIKIVKVSQANVTQLLIDLQILKGRQAVSGAVQGGQVFMFVAYLVTIAVLYLVKHCKEHQQEAARTEFELLEAKLQASRSKRRAAAARAGKQSPQ